MLHWLFHSALTCFGIVQITRACDVTLSKGSQCGGIANCIDKARNTFLCHNRNGAWPDACCVEKSKCTRINNNYWTCQAVSQSTTLRLSNIKLYVDEHNRYRNIHHSPPVIWNTTVEKAAASWVSNCKFAHDSKRSWGENLYMLPGTIAPQYTRQMIKSAIHLWYREVATYNYSAPVYNHFTQVVWKSTKTIGCSYKRCNEFVLLSCKYYPPGNYKGQFPTNVLRP